MSRVAVVSRVKGQDCKSAQSLGKDREFDVDLRSESEVVSYLKSWLRIEVRNWTWVPTDQGLVPKSPCYPTATRDLDPNLRPETDSDLDPIPNRNRLCNLTLTLDLNPLNLDFDPKLRPKVDSGSNFLH